MVAHPRPDIPAHLPTTSVLDRVTDEFDETTVPAGLLRAHRVASGVWGRLVVRHGSLRFVFEEDPDRPITVEAAGRPSVVIPPDVRHHVEIQGPVRFAVEFYRPSTDR